MYKLPNLSCKAVFDLETKFSRSLQLNILLRHAELLAPFSHQSCLQIFLAFEYLELKSESEHAQYVLGGVCVQARFYKTASTASFRVLKSTVTNLYDFKMGSLFRSEEMTLAQLFLQSEAAYACVRELGAIVSEVA